ncbi:MAG: epoxyqueuosine reductase [Oscillospiraceae bacterium]|nr:epoxyqueuosine reductase [Oscillospiraceae bacterium]
MDVKKMILDAGACAAGICDYDALIPYMNEEQLEKAQQRCPGLKSIAMGAFPYYVNPTPGNISLYTRGEDYHQVIGRRLQTVRDALAEQYPDYNFVVVADASPLPEKVAAVKAGLGYVGENCLFYTYDRGSFVFLGSVITDMPLEGATDLPKKTCSGCGKCVEACPTGAIEIGKPIDKTKCLTAMTQRKGELEDWEKKAIKAAPSAWGCDICQLACPANRDIPETYIPEFRGEGDVPYLNYLHPEDLRGISNRQFMKDYGCRALSFRGRETVLRNLEINSGK